jgi:uncharacterized membrane protein
MRTSSKFNSSRLWFRLSLILCLASSILGYVPASVRGGVVLADPPPPPEAEREGIDPGDEPGLLPGEGLEQLAEEAAVSPPTQPPASGSRTITPTIYLKARQFQPSSADALDLQSLRLPTRPGQDRVHVLVQLDFIPRQAAKDELAARGLQLLAYVPDYAWIASVSATAAATAVESPGVRWVGELTVDDKLDPAITADQWGEHNLAADGTAAVYVALHQDEGLETGRALVEAHGGQVTGEVIGINLLVVEMPKANIRALAAEDAVQWVEPAAPPLDLGNDGIRTQIGVDTVQAAPYNLDGSGIDVLVYDGGQAGDHVDFGTRLTHGDTDSVSEHATHVAGTVGGSGANSASEGGSALQWRGMAPGVDIISYAYEWDGTGMLFYDNPGDIEHDWAAAQNVYGADLGTASLTSNIYKNYSPALCDRMGNYGTTAVLVDQIARGGNSTVGIGDKYISLWCNGNERGSPGSCDTYRTISPPAGAKNPIHVGASNTNNNTMTSFSSWGPTDDGRIKPTIVAGGCQSSGDYGIKSTDNNPVDSYTVMCGCSMATPAVAGSIALMLQHYRDVYNTSGTFWPSTAKVILIQTADDFGNPGPDYQWGYGQVDVHAAVDLISRKAFRQENIAQGEVDVYYFIVPDDATPATVSLAWDDYEATFNADPTLINDLDLELVSPSGTTHYPWVLDPDNPANNATTGVNDVDNQEQVQVDTPEIGTWLVRVRGTSVPQGPQAYSLACEGCQPLNLGVCQDTVTSAAAAALGPEPASEGGMEVEGPFPEPAAEGQLPGEPLPTQGELWQRALEAQAEAGAIAEAEATRAAVEAEIAAFEIAHQAGPRAAVALGDTLRGQARDLALDEIQQAQESLVEAAPPAPDSAPISAAEEEALQQAQQAVEAANRAQALALYTDPAENQPLTSSPQPQVSSPTRPAADLTVGAGCTYATIASAIAAAIPGDRLLIEGGVTFVENLYIPISLTLQGGYDGCASGSTARTTIDGNVTNSVINIYDGLEVTLENMNITNGYSGVEGGGIQFAIGGLGGLLTMNHVDIYGNTGYWGGGLWVGPDAEVVGTDVDIYDNTSPTYGGGVRLYGGRATFSGFSNIYDNTAPSGGGVYATREDGYAPRLDLPSDADITDNQALTGNGLGGGIYMRQGTVWLADCSDLISNDAINGGGAYLVTSTLTIDGSCSEIDNNTATGYGGGVYAQDGYVNLDDGAELYSNDAGTDGTGAGGGAYLDNSDLFSDMATIWYNTADDRGGGVYATNSSTVDMDLGGYTCLGIRCSRLYYNSTSDYYGGGVYATDSIVDLRNTFVERNTADYGGGVYAYNNSTVYAYNSLFARNNAASGIGDGIRLNTADMTGNGNTLAYNDAGGAATGNAIGLSGANLTLGCSIVWGHTTSINQAGHNVTYSDIQGSYAGTGNLNVNPLFVSSGSYDYHLQNTSPVIDRCQSSNGMSTDFENDERPIVRITAASPYDMGADEAAGVDRVGINGASCAYPSIQQAVNAASDGDTIQVADGVYFETVNISGKTVTVEGGYDSTCTIANAGTTRVEGSASSGSTFAISYGGATLRNLDIAWGDGLGGGVQAGWSAQVTLDNSDVLNNHGTYGGGVYVESGSALNITNGSEVHDNTATIYGGGGRVWGKLSAYNNISYITYNCAPHGGGFAVPGGELYLNNARVYQNEAAASDGRGGGIYTYQGGTVTLTNAAYVYWLNEAYDGAGIYADNAKVYMQGGGTTIRDNLATSRGGGVYLTNNSTLHSDGARIGQPDGVHLANEAQYGAGIYAENSTVEFDGGSIVNNIAAYAGGGIYATGSTVDLTDASVGGTGDSEANQVGTSGYYGAGLYLDNTQATLSNTVVASNTLQSTWGALGGGAYLINGSDLTLTNSRVERHLAWALFGLGAGLYVDNSTVTLDNSQVLSNTAYAGGGGMLVSNASTLDMLNGSILRNNESTAGAGGGVYVDASSGIPDVNISDSTLQSNTAGADGGAVAIYAGTLDFSGWWDVQNNHAGGNGGAVAVLGTGDVDFYATGGPSYLSSNTADGNGGAIYVGNNDYVTLYATSGYTLNLQSNGALGNGGFASADSGGYFDVYGLVQVNNNVALGNGGAFYLSGGSNIWTDDSSYDRPQLQFNVAGNGGAIYAVGSPYVRCDGADFGSEGLGNQATAGSGGAIYLSGSNLDAENCTFGNGQATGDGGAIAAYTSTLVIDANYVTPLAAATKRVDERDRLDSPNAPLATGCDPLSGECSSFYSNAADTDDTNNDYGGAIYLNESALQMDTTYLHGNSAYRGGAIYLEVDASAQVSNSLFYSNTVDGNTGAAIRLWSGSVGLRHVTLANNAGPAPAYSASSGTSNAVHNSIAWGNQAGGFDLVGATVITSCNIDQSGNAGPSFDPQFVDSGAGEDYHLLGSSPAIDQCATGLPRDLDNALRPVPAGGLYDMGAYEYPYAIEFAPDSSDSGLPLSDVLYTHTLTNAGGLADTYTLTAQSDLGWPVVVSPWPTVTLNGGQSALVNVTVSIPGGTLSGTVDTTVVTATSKGDPTLTESVTDLTTVGFAPGATFEPDHVETGALENESFTYIHTLTNGGNAQDTFTLVWSSTRGWGNLLTSSPVILDPNQAQTVVVSVTVPVGGSGQSDTTIVTATSSGGAGPVVVRDITSAFTPGVAFTPDHAQTVSPDTVLTYTHRLTNTGGSTDTFHLALDSTMGWSTLLDPGPFELVQDGFTTVRVRVTVPAGSGGMTDTTILTATSAAGADPAAVHDTTATYIPDVAFVPDYDGAIDPASSITYTHSLTNTGEGPDTFDLAIASSQGWATLLDPGPFALSSGEGTTVRVRVDAPSGSGDLADVTVVTATSQAGSLSGLSARITDTTKAVRTYGVTFVPDYSQALNPGEFVIYTHQLTNTGNDPDTFDLAISSSLGWATLLSTGPFTLTAGEGTEVYVRVDVPPDSGGLADVTTVVATSQTSPTVSSGVTDTTTSIYAPGTMLTPDHSQDVSPGDTVTYTHCLTNTGNGPDWFDLSFTSSQGWATLLDGGPFQLNAGAGISVSVQVDVPPGSGGLVESTTITATSQTGGVADTANDTTNVIHTPGVEILPDWTQSVPPDNTRIYLHTLRNTGDGSDTFDVAISSSLGWATLLDTGPFALSAGDTAEVEVSVHVPSGLISGTLTDVTVITATSRADPLVLDTATDATAVGFAPGVAFAPNHLTIGASPNDVFTYTHGLTNTGNYTDNFTLDFASSAGWGSLLDSGPFDLGPGEATIVQVQVTVPPDGSWKSDISVITTTSQGGAGPAVVHDATAAFTPAVALVPDHSQMINPGDTVTYTHWLTNTGNATDTIELSLASSRGWASLADSGPFTLLSNEAITVRVLVTAPVGSGGLTDVTTVTATTLAGTGPAAHATDTTDVTYSPGVELAPNHSAIVPSGSSIIYTHYLTNTGNGPDTFAVTLHSSQGWGSLLDPGPFPLAAGGSTEVRVEVAVPTDTLAFSADVTVITATAALGGVAAMATDTTTVACEPVDGANFAFEPPDAHTGQSVTFTGTTASGSTPITYAWDFRDGSGQQTGNPIAHTFTTSGTFTVLMTATNNCPSLVTTTHDIFIAVAPTFDIYLPIVMRDYGL